MFYVFSPEKNNNKTGDTMDFNTLMQFMEYMERKQKEAKDSGKPKEDKKDKGDFWKTFFILMFATPPVAITYFLVLIYGVVMIGKVAKGL
jgi:hypothetical protein